MHPTDPRTDTWPAGPAAARRRQAWVAVGLLHAALLWGWLQSAPARSPVAPAAERAALLWLITEPVPVRPTPTTPQARPTGPQAAAPAPATRNAGTLAPRPADAAPVVPATPEALTWVAPPEPPASAPRERLLDSAATRQALREMSRQPLQSERMQAAAGQTPVTSAERLAGATAAAGKGDCLKGEYAGSGMGLLSLPFLVANVATGGCAK